MPVRIDASAFSAVAICSCGWRDVAASRRAVWLFAAAHQTAVHGYDHRVADTARKAQRRAVTG